MAVDCLGCFRTTTELSPVVCIRTSFLENFNSILDETNIKRYTATHARCSIIFSVFHIDPADSMSRFQYGPPYPIFNSLSLGSIAPLIVRASSGVRQFSPLLTSWIKYSVAGTGSGTPRCECATIGLLEKLCAVQETYYPAAYESPCSDLHSGNFKSLVISFRVSSSFSPKYFSNCASNSSGGPASMIFLIFLCRPIDLKLSKLRTLDSAT